MTPYRPKHLAKPGRQRPKYRFKVTRPQLVASAAIVVVAVGGVIVAVRDSGPGPQRLEFGIYPGGPVGTVGTTDSPVPENPGLRLAALESLRGTTSAGIPHPLVLRLYEAFTGDPQVDSWTGSGQNAIADKEVSAFTAQGFDIELVERYEPGPSLGPSALPLFLLFLRGVVDRYSPNDHVQFLQVANEVNVPNSASSSDGYYPGAVSALVYGVEAATSEVASHPHDSLQVGFNWAEQAGASTSSPLWTAISQQGAIFRKAVHWVGLDDYPGTFTSLATGPTETGPILAADAVALRTLMDRSGLPGSIPMHISETGYPTGTGRPPTAQATAIQSSITSIEGVEKRAHITLLEWFDLRDSNSSAANIQEHYGLLTDGYQPKPSFAVLQKAIASGAA